MNYTLSKKIIIKGKITALTGIAIGGSNTAMGIGGIDKGVIRNPINNQPYIPGSTLKGKMRSLLELRNGTIGSKAMGAVKNGFSEDSNARAVKLFGSANNTDRQHPSRIIVRDAYLDKDQLNNDFFKNTDLLYTEAKTEVVIDRITSKAMPRQLERVPAGAEFNFELVINIFNSPDNPAHQDNEAELLADTFTALQLVQDDYIGGSGSRGSGQINFSDIQVLERDAQYYASERETDGNDITPNYTSQFPK